jgi:hypothetical protein
MVDDNYANEKNKGDAVVFFKHIWQNFESIKRHEEEYNKNYYNKIILYQLEPLVDNHWHPKERLIENLRGADEVWDYDLQNIEVLNSYGIHAKFRPFRFSPSLKTIKNVENPDITCFFYGTMTERRASMIRGYTDGYIASDHTLEAYMNTSIVSSYRVPYQLQDEFISRSKVILNINPYEGECRQQQSRIFYLLTNNKCVLSEKANINYYGNAITEFQGSQDMGDKLIWLIQNDNWKNFTNWSGEIIV